MDQAELLQTLESSITRIKPLFPGTTCYPLSTAKKDKNKKGLFEQEFQSETHQLEKIFEITGTPSAEDIECMEDGPMKAVIDPTGIEKQFLANLDRIEPQDLKTILPSATDDAIELLNEMLQFSKYSGSI